MRAIKCVHSISKFYKYYITHRPTVGAPVVALVRGAEDGVWWGVVKLIFGAQSLGKCASVQLAVEHGAKSLRKCAKGIQKQPEGWHRAPRGSPGGTEDRQKGMLEAPRTAKKACWRHPGGSPGPWKWISPRNLKSDFHVSFVPILDLDYSFISVQNQWFSTFFYMRVSACAPRSLLVDPQTRNEGSH